MDPGYTLLMQDTQLQRQSGQSILGAPRTFFKAGFLCIFASFTSGVLVNAYGAMVIAKLVLCSALRIWGDSHLAYLSILG